MQEYRSRLRWDKFGKKKYRSFDGRFVIEHDPNAYDYKKPEWMLHDVLTGKHDWLPSFKACRIKAYEIQDEKPKSRKENVSNTEKVGTE